MSGAADREPSPQGCLVAVVGPSGAGKDTLIRIARDRLRADPRFLFPRRTVTRPPSEAEDNEPCDEAAFRRREQEGGFGATWRAHGLSYGIPASALRDLAFGRCIVVNVSRTVLDELRGRYARVFVLEVAADPRVLAERLAARGRPEDGSVAARLRRSEEVARVRSDATVDNSGAVEDAASAFLAALDQAASAREAEPEMNVAG